MEIKKLKAVALLTAATLTLPLTACAVESDPQPAGANTAATATLSAAQTAREIVAAYPVVAHVYNANKAYHTPIVDRRVAFEKADPAMQKKFAAEVLEQLPQAHLFHTDGMTDVDIARMFEIMAVNYNQANGAGPDGIPELPEEVRELWADQLEVPLFEKTRETTDLATFVVSRLDLTSMLVRLPGVRDYVTIVRNNQTVGYIPPFIGIELEKVNGRWVYGKRYGELRMDGKGDYLRSTLESAPATLASTIMAGY